MLKAKVKAGGITNLTDARYFAAWEVEWLGFNLDPDAVPHLSPREMIAIREWVEGVRFVGEFNRQTAPELREAVDLLQLDDIQVGPLTSAETLIELGSEISVIKELLYLPEKPAETIQEQLEAFAPLVSHFQLSLDKQGIHWEDLLRGKPLSLAQVRDWASEYSILLGIEIAPDQIQDLSAHLPLSGICGQGGEQEKVAFKSFDDLDDFFEAIRVEEA
jgi:phosphoribosylanthranilate isomerase